MDRSVATNPHPSRSSATLRRFLQSLDSPGYWHREPGLCVRVFMAYLAVHAGLVAVGYGLTLYGTDIVVFWPAAGLLVATLTCTPARTWPLWIFGSIAGRLLVDFFVVSRFPGVEIGFSLASAVEALLFAALLRRPLEQSFRLHRPLYLAAGLVIVAGLAAGVGGLTGAAVLELLSDVAPEQFWTSWRIWVAADFLGIIVIAPMVAWALLPQIRIRRAIATGVETIALWLFLALVMSVAVFAGPVFDQDYLRAGSSLLSVLLAMPLLWAAIRFSYPVLAASQLLLTMSVITATSRGMGPFAPAGDSPLPVMAELQIFLIVTVLAAMLLAFALMERQIAGQELHLQHGLNNVLITLINKLVAANADQLDVRIKEVLQEIAHFARADRCVLMQIGDDAVVTATHQWAGDDGDSCAAEPATAGSEEFSRTVARLRDEGYIVLHDPDWSLQPGVGELRRILGTPAAASAIYVGLFTGGKLIGCIGCGYVRPGEHWSSESLSLMYLVGQLFANVLERKHAENRLVVYQEKLRTLAMEVSISEERARRRAAIDLHDGIGQSLAVARMKVGQLLAGAAGEGNQLKELRSLIDDALRGTRFIIADLSPSILYELGLVPALQSLAERFEPANDMHCTVEELGMCWEPDNDMRIALYRAVQEMLNNISRHAQAGCATIRVEWQPDRIKIEVRDDGAGLARPSGTAFDPATTGFGLFWVRESVRVLGGTVTMDSKRGIGTTISISVPRPGEAMADDGAHTHSG